MKKVIFAIIIAVIVFSFTFPIYADQPTLPGELGMGISLQAQDGDRADIVAMMIEEAGAEGLSLGQGWKAYWDSIGWPQHRHEP